MKPQNHPEVQEQVSPYLEEASMTVPHPQDAANTLLAQLHQYWGRIGLALDFLE